MCMQGDQSSETGKTDWGEDLGLTWRMGVKEHFHFPLPL